MMMNRRCPTVSLETLRSSLQVGGVILPAHPPAKGNWGTPPDPRPFDSRSRAAQDRPDGIYFRSNDNRGEKPL